MKNVTQMITLVKEASGLSKDKEIEDLLGIRPMGLASLKKENRVGSFLKFLVPFCEKENISIDEFLKDDVKVQEADAIINTDSREEEEMLKQQLIDAQNKIISLLEENSLLKEQLLGKPEASPLKTKKKKIS